MISLLFILLFSAPPISHCDEYNIKLTGDDEKITKYLNESEHNICYMNKENGKTDLFFQHVLDKNVNCIEPSRYILTPNGNKAALIEDIQTFYKCCKIIPSGGDLKVTVNDKWEIISVWRLQ